MTAAPNQSQPGTNDVPSRQFYDGSVGAQFLAPTDRGPALFQYRYQQGPWQDAGEDYYNFCRKEREHGNLNFDVRALCECSDAPAIDILTARAAVTEAAAAITHDTTISHSIANRFTEIMGAKMDAANTHQRCDAGSDELAEWKQAASVEAGLRREFLARAERQKIVLDWIESWVSNPVGAYSVSALDGLFGMTRDKIAALSFSSAEGKTP